VAVALLDRHYFLLRRLHSLSGIVPIGVFLIGHLTTNSSIIWGVLNGRAARHAEGAGPLGTGVATFQEEVSWINNLPFLLLIEITLWVSIGFHAALGVYYARTGRSNTARYAYQDNWRYTLQRLSGYVALLYIFYHVATLRWGWTWLVPGGAKWSHEYASSTLAMALRGSEDAYTVGGMVVVAFYFLGVTASVFHFANGLWTAAITWGLTISAQAQRRWGAICAALGVVLMGMAWSSVVGFALLDPADARMVEDRLHGPGPVEPVEPVEDAAPGSDPAALAPGSGIGASPIDETTGG